MKMSELLRQVDVPDPRWPNGSFPVWQNLIRDNEKRGKSI